MQMSVLTAAVQEPIPRNVFEEQPIDAALQAALIWIQTAREIGLDGLQLSAALARPDAYIPPEAMLDPVAPHTPVRTRRDGTGQDLSDEDARDIIGACGEDVSIFDLGCFENLMHPDDTIRHQIHQHMLRVARAAKMLAPVGCTGITGFIGANPEVDLDQNLDLFERWVIPLLKEFKKLGITFWVENCPMPGWNTTGYYFNNLAYCAGMWITLWRIAEKHGVADVLRFTYDASHDILLGTTPYASFSALEAIGLNFLANRFHGKDQNRDPAKVALWTVMGQRVGLGCRKDGKPLPDPRDQGKAWGVMTASHSMPGISTYDPVGQILGLRVDWFSHQYHARKVLDLNPRKTVFHIEHEWGAARDQNLHRVAAMIKLSAQFMRAIDAAADAKYRAELWCEENSLPVPGSVNPFDTIPGLEDEAQKIE